MTMQGVMQRVFAIVLLSLTACIESQPPCRDSIDYLQDRQTIMCLPGSTLSVEVINDKRFVVCRCAPPDMARPLPDMSSPLYKVIR